MNGLLATTIALTPLVIGTVAAVKSRDRRVSVTLGILDEKTWNAVDVTSPPAEGHLTDSCSVKDYDTGTVYSVDDFPASIDYGHEVDGVCDGLNTSGLTKELTIFAEVIDPDGVSRVSNSKTDDVLDNVHIAVATPHVVLDKAGTWKLHCKLSS